MRRMTVANLHLELPPELHKKLKLKAVKQQRPIKDLIVTVLEKRL